MQCLAISAGCEHGQVARRIDHVRIDAWTVLPDFADELHTTSSGCAILPMIADAAAVAGLARNTSDSGCPIRPLKLRLVVLTHLSFAARTPMCPPQQGPHVGVLTAQPDSMKISISPSFSACL